MAVRSTLACLVLLLVHVVLVTLYASAFVLPLPFGRARIRRCIAAYQYCLVDWVELVSVLFPVATLALSGDAPRTATAATPIVLVANHQVDADWWYLQQYVRLVGAVPQLKLCMKSSLAYVPCMGWTMALLEFLFLRRDLTHDKPHVQQYMESFVEDAFPVWLMLFPEGTTIHTECVTKSQKFATAQGRPTLERVLLPRAAGLQLLLDAHANKDVKPEIYDITIGYPSYAGEVPTYEMSATSTRVCPPCNNWSQAMGRRSCICTSRATPLQPSPATIVGFLDRQWSQKEHWLAHFAQHEVRTLFSLPQFTEQARCSALQRQPESWRHHWYNLTCRRHAFDGRWRPSGVWPCFGCGRAHRSGSLVRRSCCSSHRSDLGDVAPAVQVGFLMHA